MVSAWERDSQAGKNKGAELGVFMLTSPCGKQASASRRETAPA